MLFLNFLYAAALFAIGIGALNTGQPIEEAPLAYTGIFFGGSALICALFAIKNRLHGLMAAGFLSFLAILTAGKSLFSVIRARELSFADPQILLLCTFLLISAAYFCATIVRWRTRPMDAA